MNIKKLIFDTVYCVGYRKSCISIWDEEKSSFSVLKPSIKYWYADPVPYEIGNKIYVFVEQYDRINKIGYIGVCELTSRGRLTKPQIIIKNSSHMSFPMILEYKHEYYMFPECSASGEIVIYKMGESPYDWKLFSHCKTEEPVVDINYVIRDNYILLIGSVIESGSHYTKRVIYSLRNMDESDISIERTFRDEASTLDSRNAGGLLRKDEKIYRVIQESTEQVYGYNLVLKEIISLDDDDLEEKYIQSKYPNDFSLPLCPLLYRPAGVHTYGKTESGFEVVDMVCIKPSIVPLLRRLLLR